MSRKWTKEQKEELARKVMQRQEYQSEKNKKREEQYKLLSKKETEYMLNHLKSLEDPKIIIECVFVCGRLSEPNNDLCEICELNYTEYFRKKLLISQIVIQ